PFFFFFFLQTCLIDKSTCNETVRGLIVNTTDLIRPRVANGALAFGVEKTRFGQLGGLKVSFARTETKVFHLRQMKIECLHHVTTTSAAVRILDHARVIVAVVKAIAIILFTVAYCQLPAHNSNIRIQKIFCFQQKQQKSPPPPPFLNKATLTVIILKDYFLHVVRGHACCFEGLDKGYPTLHGSNIHTAKSTKKSRKQHTIFAFFFLLLEKITDQIIAPPKLGLRFKETAMLLKTSCTRKKTVFFINDLVYDYILYITIPFFKFCDETMCVLLVLYLHKQSQTYERKERGKSKKFFTWACLIIVHLLVIFDVLTHENLKKKQNKTNNKQNIAHTIAKQTKRNVVKDPIDHMDRANRSDRM
ncbi:hypothetical protein RFI_24018, partial [Reticulomyxa filosa]